MKRYLLLIASFVVIVNCLIFSSCKDLTHYPHPSPGGVRLASYSLVGSSSYSLTPLDNSTENDNYAFTYDSLNRVSYVTFSTNNPYKSNLDISFVYSNDTIYKTTTSVIPTIPVEIDTFIINSQGQLIIAFTPNTTTTFQYYENLLTTMTTTNETTKASVKETYTSDVGNFLEGTSTAGTAANQNFFYNTKFVNRIGDYFQLQSFTMYGINVYQYASMVSQVTQTNQTMYFTYAIDAYSNVNQTIATTVTPAGNDTTTVYSMQYENY